MAVFLCKSILAGAIIEIHSIDYKLLPHQVYMKKIHNRETKNLMEISWKLFGLMQKIFYSTNCTHFCNFASSQNVTRKFDNNKKTQIIRTFTEHLYNQKSVWQVKIYILYWISSFFLYFGKHLWTKSNFLHICLRLRQRRSLKCVLKDQLWFLTFFFFLFLI